MNNWMSRIAIFAVLGAILSSAVLVGCGGSNGDDTNAAAPAKGNAASSNSAS